MIEQAEHVMIYTEQWPMQTGSVTYDFDFRQLRTSRIFKTLQLLSRYGNSYPVGEIKTYQILVGIVTNLKVAGIMGLEGSRTVNRRINLLIGNRYSMCFAAHACSPRL